jgi:hypothetical protein
LEVRARERGFEPGAADLEVAIGQSTQDKFAHGGVGVLGREHGSFAAHLHRR